MADTALFSSKQPGESQAAYSAFCLFRDLGPERTLGEVTRRIQQKARGTTLVFESNAKAKVKQPSGTVGLWSRKFDWIERAAAFDNYLDTQRLKRTVTEIQAMSKRHADQANVAIQALMSPIVAFARRLQTPQGQEELQKATLAELLALSMASARLVGPLQMAERLSRGVRIEKRKDEVQGGSEWLIRVHQPESTAVDTTLQLTGPSEPTEWEGDAGGKVEDDD